MSEDKDFDIEEVRHMASLSRLRIKEDEVAMFANQFGKILGHMDILEKVDTSNIQPLYTPAQGGAAVLEDKARNLRAHGEILANAPETDGESFIVPRIV